MQEKEKAAEEHRWNVAEYRKFLESCNLIKVCHKNMAYAKNLRRVFILQALFVSYYRHIPNGEKFKIA